MFSVIFKFVILIVGIKNSAGEPVAFNLSLCGQESELRLEGSGVNSSVILTLDPETRTSTCKLRVSAPETHIIYINLIEEEEEDVESIKEITGENENVCLLSVFVPENRRAAVWRINPCSQTQPSEGTLVHHQARIVWNVPDDQQHITKRKLSLTALTQWEECRQAGKHICLKVGWTPQTCVSEELMCDGVENCPGGGSSDEDIQLCRDKKTLSKTSWERIASEFLKKFAGKSHSSTGLVPVTSDDTSWFIQRDTFFRHSETTEKSNNNVKYRNRPETDTLAGILSRYGPWGYLMLGMLVCGAALMVCGLWECCCRKAKTPDNRQTPRASSTAPPSTTVLIINPQQGSTSQNDEVSQSPPNYEDLDQPPSYSALFPTAK